MPAAAGAELVDCPLLCYVLTSLSVSIGEGQTPPEMPLGAPPSGLTGAAAGAAFCGAGLLGAFLSKNVLTLLSSSASTASMIICLHSSLCRTPDSAPSRHKRTRFATKCCPTRARKSYVWLVLEKNLVSAVSTPVLLHPRDCPACLCSLVEAPTAGLATQAICTPPRVLWKSLRAASNFESFPRFTNKHTLFKHEALTRPFATRLSFPRVLPSAPRQ